LGEAIPVVEDVRTRGTWYAISLEGTLVYHTKTDLLTRELVWLDHEGREEVLKTSPQAFVNPRISPDGSYIAVTVPQQPTLIPDMDLWVYSLVDDSRTRLTFNESVSPGPIWSPDGKHLIFAKDAEKYVSNLFTIAVDGSGSIDRLTSSDGYMIASSSWAFKSEVLMVTECISPARHNCRIGNLNIKGNKQFEPLHDSEFSEANPMLSPDGQWLAFESNRSGENEVWISSFPEISNQWLVTNGGGTMPKWSPDGTLLYYLSRNIMMAVPIKTSPNFDSGTPKALFDLNEYRNSGGKGIWSPGYDVAPDGRFLVARLVSEEKPEIVVVVNWFDELARLVPVGSE
jgi:serine/threonine-protein kinase